MRGKARVCGIICEWNPFHKGHAALLEASRENGVDFHIAVMSGNFVQRGGPSIFSKWARAEMALACGVDLVLELPIPWAMAGAERFALGGMSLLESLGCVDFLAFGSETGDVDRLRQAARVLLSSRLRPELQRRMKEGVSFAHAREQAVSYLFGEEAAAVLQSPNDILGTEYCKALERLHSSIEPFTIQRKGAGHDQNASHPETFASSSQIRSQILKNRSFSSWMPEPAVAVAQRELHRGLAPVSEGAFSQAVLARLRTMTIEEFSLLPDLSEGIEHRLFKAVRTASSLEDLLFAVKSKRYPLARIRRLIFSAFLGIPSLPELPFPPYARILGFRSSAGELLSQIRKNARIPIVSTNAEMAALPDQARSVLNLEIRASDLYALAQPEIQPCGLDLTRKLLVFPVGEGHTV